MPLGRCGTGTVTGDKPKSSREQKVPEKIYSETLKSFNVLDLFVCVLSQLVLYSGRENQLLQLLAFSAPQTPPHCGLIGLLSWPGARPPSVTQRLWKHVLRFQ